MLAATQPLEYGVDTAHHTMVRDGKCAELVMWWIHHLTGEARAALSGVDGFKVPLLPTHENVGLHASLLNQGSEHSNEYIYQVSCSDCHSTGINANANANANANTTSSSSVTAINRRPKISAAAGNPPPGTCPIDPKSNLPSVWYQPMSDVGNRKKRCDWDYDPPCGTDGDVIGDVIGVTLHI